MLMPTVIDQSKPKPLTSKSWLETLSLGIVINLIFRPWNRNQLKKLESESIFYKSGGIPGIS